MRVFVVEMSGKGGMIHYDYHLCRALSRSGVNISLVTSNHYELGKLPHNFKVFPLLRLWDPRASTPHHSGVRLLRRGMRGLLYVAGWLRLLHFIGNERPEVVIFGEIRFGFERIFLQYLKRMGLCLVGIVHDIQPFDTSRTNPAIIKNNREYVQKYNKIYHSFNALFVHDQQSYRDFLALYDVPAERVHQIPFGTSEIIFEEVQSTTPEELRQLFGIPPTSKVVLFFGTLTKYKGVEDLIRAFPLVCSEFEAHLVIAGFPAKDVDSKKLQAEAEKLGVADHITWYLDYVPNDRVAPLVTLSETVVLPYRAITQSGVLQIAYACGRPVVGTRVGGLPDVIEDEGTGLLVEPYDPNALARAINRILSDSDLAERMGRRALEMSRTVYSWNRVADSINNVLQRL